MLQDSWWEYVELANWTPDAWLGTMRSAHGVVKRCPVCRSGVVDRFRPFRGPSKANPAPSLDQGATAMANRIVCSADSDQDLHPG